MRAALVLAGSGLLLTACAGAQSALDPRGPAASHLATLAWVLFVGGLVIFLGTMALLALGLFRPRWVGRVRPQRLIVWGGAVFPVVTLLLLTVYTALVGRWSDLSIADADAAAPLEVRIVGVMWWWEIVYPDPDGSGRGPVVTANELHLPVGRPVRILLESRDVIHSFWVPALHGKMDLIPGRVNRITVQADAVGVLRGQCAEFCGAQHALMSMLVVAQPPEAFAAWVERQRRPASPPADPEHELGSRLFLAQGCGACHTVRGLADGTLMATGELGPDLTHVGSRLTLGAATLPNGVGPLAGWIAGVQHIKPGARMPSYDTLTGPELKALARYLESLE